MTPAEREIEQCRLIEMYLSELWCPARPVYGPEPIVYRGYEPAAYRWVRQLDKAALRQLPYADVLEAIRAA
jgi:hypothetical protein